MRFSIESIDPAKAKSLLAKNVRNRPLNSTTVERYASDMARGAWEDTGDTVKISRSGFLLDGQHRLEAVIKAGVTISFAIVYDISDRAWDSIDIGRIRKASDIVAVKGHKNYTTVASAARLVYLDERGLLDLSHPSLAGKGSKCRHVTNRDVDSTVDACPDIPDCAVAINTIYRFAGQLLAYGLGAFLLWKLRRINVEQADRFFGAVTDGLGLTAESPIFILRERLIRNQAEKRKLERREIYAFAVKAWNADRLKKRFSADSLRLRTRGPAQENNLAAPV